MKTTSEIDQYFGGKFREFWQQENMLSSLDVGGHLELAAKRKLAGEIFAWLCEDE